MDEIALRLRVEQFLAAYTACLDDDRLEEWPALFTEHCVYKVIPYENVAQHLPVALMFGDSQAMLRDRVTAHRRANLYAPHRYRHLLGPLRVREAPAENTVEVRANLAVYRTMLDPADYGRSELFAVGEYQDRLVWEQGQLRVREKIVVVDTAKIPTLLVTPL
ncbi:MAG TPA: aromatic-ring-hydroxylating dioxygenase subunit beta [Candidatus Binataceae bacterium]|nr:aromatic-ring-hydroxylating dioxygenase subunit beta [Candidatus Binataceae bacterium]